MHLKYRNVNSAFAAIVRDIHDGTILVHVEPSRVGEVLRIPEPIILTYFRPQERVLFNRARDCNPFFHLFESLWMLAGRRDADPLAYFTPRIRSFSDDGTHLHGAYGHRWRYHFGGDQLEMIIKELSDNPRSRRCVLSMWDATVPDPSGNSRIGAADLVNACQGGKDVPCNLSVVFDIEDDGHSGKKYLNMSVFNRSNDILWGMLGANVVHFSFLQEYVAQCIGVSVGVYNQISTNAHFYSEYWEPEKWLKDETADAYLFGDEKHFPLVADREVFDREVRQFIDDWDSRPDDYWTDPFLRDVALPMCLAFMAHKQRDYPLAFNHLEGVQAADWRGAGRNWVFKRMQNHRRKTGEGVIEFPPQLPKE